MIDQPLTSGEQTKIFIFIILLIPYIGVGAGILPVIFILWGLFQAKRNRDFTFIEVSKKYFKTYTILVIIFVSIPLIGMVLNTAIFHYWSAEKIEAMILMSLLIVSVIVVPILYIFLANKLYFTPLQNHKKWVENNIKIFNKPKFFNKSKTESSIKIMKIMGVKTYSVADELLKWSKLKENGLVTDEEFEQAKSKLLR